MAEIYDLWRRVERWFDAEPQLPTPGEVFRPPASDAEIAEAERTLGHSFPESFRASLAVHDGQIFPEENGLRYVGVQWLPNQMCLLPLTDIVKRWQEERNFEAELVSDIEGMEEETGELDRVRGFPSVTHAGRVPIAEQEGSSYFYLDFVPGPAGRAGQVIMTRTECDFMVVGEDFAHFLTRYVDLLERGVLRYDAEEYNSVIPPNPQMANDDLFEL